MERVRFSKEQPAVMIKSFDEKDFIYLCLNGKTGEDEETGEEYTEYDYNEIICPSGTLDTEDVEANPENYIDYVYQEEAELSVEEQLNDIQLAQAEMYEMLIEMMNG